MHSRKSGLCFIVSFFDLRNAPTVIREIAVVRTDASLINMSFFQSIKTAAKWTVIIGYRYRHGLHYQQKHTFTNQPFTDRQEGHPACKKNLEWWGTGMVICLERDADLHMA